MKRMHPLVNAIYFLYVIIFSMMVSHPALIVILLLCASFVVIRTKGIRNSVKYLKFIIPLAIITAIINPLFSHEGITILARFPDGNLLTLESICFGLGMALKLMTIFIWFIYINEIMTSDKIMYLIGAVAPYIANTFSMILHFIPRLHVHIKEVWTVRRIAANNIAASNIIDRNTAEDRAKTVVKMKHRKKCGRLREAIKVLSSSITWIIDDSVDTANSMRCRGYAARKRISYSVYRFTMRDFEWIAVLTAVYTMLFICYTNKMFYWQYYPYIISGDAGVMFYVGAALLFVTGIMPAINRTERMKKWYVR